MDQWDNLLLNLCSMAQIAAGNIDLSVTEREHLRQLADEVSREVIRKANENCGTCDSCCGPIMLMCMNGESEFFEGPVVPNGWCPEWHAVAPAAGEEK